MYKRLSLTCIFIFFIAVNVVQALEMIIGQATDGKDSGTVLEVRRTSPAHTTYYVDAAAGHNENSGTSANKAWKTLAPVNAFKLAPGDKILLKAGCTFDGPLAPKGSGIESEPIVIDTYGQGDKAVLAGRGKVENTLRLHNQSYWKIRNLTITNTDGGDPYSDEGRAVRRAVYITAEDAGDVKHISLNNLEIREVRGMYRFDGNNTNGGIICRVLGGNKPTRFVGLRIENCVFRTNSIDRYPIVVTSSWKKQAPCEVVWKDNTLDHAGRAYIVVQTSEWPRQKVYYYCPECRELFALDKTAAPVCKKCGRLGCENIFSEMASRLKQSWSFFEATRLEPGRWLFKMDAAARDYSLWATDAMALGYYGELRALGFKPPWSDREQEVMDAWIAEVLRHRDAKDNLIKGPGAPAVPREIDKWGYLSFGFQWQLRNRVFLAGKYAAPPGCQVSEDFCRDEETAMKLFDSLPWAANPYWACNMIGSKAILNHRDILLASGRRFPDEVTELLHKRIDSKYNTEKGYWGGQKASHVNRTSGDMKMLVTYAVLDWEIPNPKKIIDFVLSGADEKAGFRGRGCSAFNQMFSLAAVRRKYPELASYRGEEIDKYTAMTFMTFLANWNEKLNFYADNWNGKHNNGVVLFMPQLILDQPYMRASTVYNWHYCPMIMRDKAGHVTVNKVIYNTEGFPFSG
jgi:hypothetical protein